MNGSGALAATHLLIADLGDHTYRLTFGNQRQHVAITTTGSQLDRWTAEIRAAIGAPPLPRRPYRTGPTHTPGAHTTTARMRGGRDA